MNPKTCVEFAKEIIRELQDVKPSMLASSTIGGILLATRVATMLGIPMLVGKQGEEIVDWVDTEKLDKNSLSKVVLIDDILTTGDSLESAIQSLRHLGAKVASIIVAIDRSAEHKNELRVNRVFYKVSSLIQLDLNNWEPNECQICPKNPQYTNLQNPEKNFINVILSMPAKSDIITEGYKTVYALQRDEEQLQEISQWEPWLQPLFAGLPIMRVMEDRELAQFINLLNRDEIDINRRRIFSEIIGHLLMVSHISIESRPLGCSILIGDEEKLRKEFQNDVPLVIPNNIKICMCLAVRESVDRCCF